MTVVCDATPAPSIFPSKTTTFRSCLNCCTLTMPLQGQSRSLIPKWCFRAVVDPTMKFSVSVALRCVLQCSLTSLSHVYLHGVSLHGFNILAPFFLQLQSAVSVTFQSVTAGATVVINVSGASVQAGNFAFLGQQVPAAHVVWNFYEATR